jgi:type II secretory pathway pseudopilin PulG
MLGGAVMVAVSIFGLYGAATGRLAAMLAAILAPSLLSQTEQSKLRANLGVNYSTQQACELVNGKGNCMSATDPKTGKTVWGVNPLKAAPSV